MSNYEVNQIPLPLLSLTTPDTKTVINKWFVPDLTQMVLEYCWPGKGNTICGVCFYGNYEKMLTIDHQLIWTEILQEYKNCKLSFLLDGSFSEKSLIWEYAFREVCAGGYMKMIELIIEKNSNCKELEIDWNWGLMGACFGGHAEIARLMIKNGASFKKNNYSDLNQGLYYACLDGHIEIAELLIEEGATNWAKGLCGACDGGSEEAVKLMIKHAKINDVSIKCSCTRKKSCLFRRYFDAKVSK